MLRISANYAEAERLVDKQLLEWGVELETLRRLDQWGQRRGFRRM